MKSESFWFTSNASLGAVAESFRQAVEAHNGMRQKMAGGISFERPIDNSRDDPFRALSTEREDDFHVVAVIEQGRLETSVPIGLHLRLWDEGNGVLGEVQTRWSGMLMASGARKWLGRAVEGMKQLDRSIAETQAR